MLKVENLIDSLQAHLSIPVSKRLALMLQISTTVSDFKKIRGKDILCIKSRAGRKQQIAVLATSGRQIMDEGLWAGCLCAWGGGEGGSSAQRQ